MAALKGEDILRRRFFYNQGNGIEKRGSRERGRYANIRKVGEKRAKKKIKGKGQRMA